MAFPSSSFSKRRQVATWAVGTVYAALVRLEAKGYVRSTMGEAAQVRGGKRKRLYEASAQGLRAVKNLRRIRERIWLKIEAEGKV